MTQAHPAITIDTLAASDPSAVQLTPLSFLVEQQLEECYSAPSPPLIRDPSKGSASPEDFPNFRDPEYLRKRAAWGDRFDLLRFAVAARAVFESGLGFEYAHADKGGEKWCEGMIGSLGSMVSRQWVERAAARLEELTLPSLVETAAKNSSAP